MASAKNGQLLYDLVTSLLGGEEMDQTLFYTLLNIAKDNIEIDRPWVWRRKKDSSKTWLTSDRYTTAKALPTDFRRYYGDYPIQAVDSAGNLITKCKQTTLDRQLTEKDLVGKFFVDYKAGNFYMTGFPAATLTLYQFYLSKGDDIDEDSAWDFPAEYHPILAYYVSVYYKLGVDYDIINNTQGENNAAIAGVIYSRMMEWDDLLQNESLPDYEEYAG